MTVFHEFPKAVYPGGEFTVVHDADHEATVMASAFATSAEPASDKEALAAQAAELGIEVDRRWGVARLRSEIAAVRE